MAIHLLDKLPTEPGMHGDGNGLYLHIKDSGASYWVLRYTWQGEREKMQLANARNIPIADAREWAREQHRIMKVEKRNPKEKRDIERYADNCPLFYDFAKAQLQLWANGWKNDKHRDQWFSTILGEDVTGNKVEAEFNYCASIHKRRIDDINAGHVIALLEPIWHSKKDTARRIRGRLEKLWYAARAKHENLVKGECPADLQRIKAALGQQKKKTKHHAALPYEMLPTFMVQLRSEPYDGARMLELTVLTCARTHMILEMEWPEVDLGRAIWTVPEGKTKNGCEAQIPLCARAVEILREQHARRLGEGLVWVGRDNESQVSNMTMDKALKKLAGDTPATVHGVRSTFEDWAGDETDTQQEVIDFCLHHLEGSETRAAYRRRTALKKRTELIKQWEAYCYSAFTKGPRLVSSAA